MRSAVPALLLAGLAGCFPALEPGDYATGRIDVPPAGAGGVGGDTTPGRSGAPARVDAARRSGEAEPWVELQYLGVGGWRVETPHTVLLTGPLLTRPGMFEVGLGAVLTPDTAAILEALAAWEVGPLDRTAAILVGHGHYDHLLDTPWLAARLAPRARI
ncbi:MAG: hypothetical protein RQ751_10730, partial [Longimicrobiales bacterium]|nr:hypothetical protein [Longimicrobiales bacterium]